MKKATLVLILFVWVSSVSAPTAYASEGFIKSSSPFYFLQTLGESVRLFFTFSKDQKIDYLLELTDRRVSELADTASPAVATHYEDTFKQLNELSTQVSDTQVAVDKIKEASLRQQQVLTTVYNKVPDQAKSAIQNAQENSLKHVTRAVEAIEGTEQK